MQVTAIEGKYRGHKCNEGVRARLRDTDSEGPVQLQSDIWILLNAVWQRDLQKEMKLLRRKPYCAPLEHGTHTVEYTKSKTKNVCPVMGTRWCILGRCKVQWSTAVTCCA